MPFALQQHSSGIPARSLAIKACSVCHAAIANKSQPTSYADCFSRIRSVHIYNPRVGWHITSIQRKFSVIEHFCYCCAYAGRSHSYLGGGINYQTALPDITCCGIAIGCQVCCPDPEATHTCSMPASVPATTYTASACCSGSMRACCHGMALCFSSMLVWLTDNGCSPVRLPAEFDCLASQ